MDGSAVEVVAWLAALVLTASWGGGLPGVELSAGLELALPDLDVGRV